MKRRWKSYKIIYCTLSRFLLELIFCKSWLCLHFGFCRNFFGRFHFFCQRFLREMSSGTSLDRNKVILRKSSFCWTADFDTGKQFAYNLSYNKIQTRGFLVSRSKVLCPIVGRKSSYSAYNDQWHWKNLMSGLTVSPHTLDRIQLYSMGIVHLLNAKSSTTVSNQV